MTQPPKRPESPTQIHSERDAMLYLQSFETSKDPLAFKVLRLRRVVEESSAGEVRLTALRMFIETLDEMYANSEKKDAIDENKINAAQYEIMTKAFETVAPRNTDTLRQWYYTQDLLREYALTGAAREVAELKELMRESRARALEAIRKENEKRGGQSMGDWSKRAKKTRDRKVQIKESRREI